VTGGSAFGHRLSLLGLRSFARSLGRCSAFGPRLGSAFGLCLALARSGFGLRLA
jgi:hypothetical protein